MAKAIPATEVAAAIPITCPPPGVKSLGGDALEFQHYGWIETGVNKGLSTPDQDDLVKVQVFRG